MMVPEGMDTEYDFGDVFLVVQVRQLKPKDGRQPHRSDGNEEIVDVIGVSEL
jgi:hypothetical protein